MSHRDYNAQLRVIRTQSNHVAAIPEATWPQCLWAAIGLCHVAAILDAMWRDGMRNFRKSSVIDVAHLIWT